MAHYGIGIVLPNLVFPLKHSKPCIFLASDRVEGRTGGTKGSPVEIAKIYWKYHRDKKQITTTKLLLIEGTRGQMIHMQVLITQSPQQYLTTPQYMTPSPSLENGVRCCRITSGSMPWALLATARINPVVARLRTNAHNKSIIHQQCPWKWTSTN